MSSSYPILIASDHAGVDLKSYLIQHMKSWEWKDLGPNTTERSDYPDFASKVAVKIAENPKQKGILICGSGIGMSIVANKYKGVRAALAWNPDTARLSREHNDANILCLGARFLSSSEAVAIVNAWLETDFLTEERYQKRLEKLLEIENNAKGIFR